MVERGMCEPNPSLISAFWDAFRPKSSPETEPELRELQDTLRHLKQRNVILSEIVATLSIPRNHRFIPPPLRELVDRWRSKLDLDYVSWEPWDSK